MDGGQDQTLVLFHSVELNASDAEEFRDCMRRLPGILSEEPLGVTVTTDSLPAELVSAVEAIGAAPSFTRWAAEMMDHLFDFYQGFPKLIVACRPKHRLAELAIRETPIAAWGVACGSIALSYCLNNPYVVWHETLHLLGADDCYALPDRGPICELANCIMQYEPSHSTVGDWPFLCEANQERVRERVSDV